MAVTGRGSLAWDRASGAARPRWAHRALYRPPAGVVPGNFRCITSCSNVTRRAWSGSVHSAAAANKFLHTLQRLGPVPEDSQPWGINAVCGIHTLITAARTERQEAINAGDHIAHLCSQVEPSCVAGPPWALRNDGCRHKREIAVVFRAAPAASLCQGRPALPPPSAAPPALQ